MADKKIMNKTMALSDLKSDKAKTIMTELNDLINNLKDKDLKISSWYGFFKLSGKIKSPEVLNRGFNYEPIEGAVDDQHFPWFLYWEIVWVVLNAGFKKGQKVLDLGGSSSLFSYYLASKNLDVTTVDLQKELVTNANQVAGRMGWKLKNHVMDMRHLDFNCHFDHITSICVYEHIPMYDRIEINHHIKNLLVPGGRFSITFDYRNPARFARIGTPDEVYRQFVEPSGLSLRGNRNFVDSGVSYLLYPFFSPDVSWRHKIFEIKRGHFNIREFFKRKYTNDYTFGALFLEKT